MASKEKFSYDINGILYQGYYEVYNEIQVPNIESEKCCPLFRTDCYALILHCNDKQICIRFESQTERDRVINNSYKLESLVKLFFAS